MIYQTKGNIFLYLVFDVILRIDVKVKKQYDENLFFHLYFSNVHISVNNEFENLRLGIQVANIHVEGTVSQIFVLVFNLCKKKKRATFLLFF